MPSESGPGPGHGRLGTISVSRARVSQRPAAGPAGLGRRTGRSMGGLSSGKPNRDTMSPDSSEFQDKLSRCRQPEPPSQPLQRRLQRPGPQRLDSSSSFEFQQTSPMTQSHRPRQASLSDSGPDPGYWRRTQFCTPEPYLKSESGIIMATYAFVTVKNPHSSHDTSHKNCQWQNQSNSTSR